MKKGKLTETYFAVARHSGKPRPYDTELIGRERTAEAVEDLQTRFGGHIVEVTQTTEWKPAPTNPTKKA